jgi:hypothetical protein
MTKNDKIIAGLIGVGAVLAIIYVMKSGNGQNAATNATGEVLPPNPINLPSYPNTQPIPSTSFTVVSGSAPDALYNVPVNGYPLSDYGLGEIGDGCPCGGDTDPCAEVTTLQSKMTIPPEVLKAAVSNLKSYQQKRVSFTQG